MKLTIIGGGGARTPLMIQALAARQDSLGINQVVLMDVDAERLETIAVITRSLETSGNLRFQVTRTTDLVAALADANYVITTFRVGGLPARVIDEQVPFSYGLLGQETTGPGGFAMGMCSLPVLMEIIDVMRLVCPQAWLINFANPSGMLTEAILRVAGWERAVGICDEPAAMHKLISAALQAQPAQVHMDYFGLNHLGWVRSVVYRDQDVLPQLIALIWQTGGLPELPFTPEFLDRLGMIPNPYLYYYYNHDLAAKNILQAEQTRAEKLLALTDELFAALRQSGSDPDPSAMGQIYLAYIAQRGESYMSTETGGMVNYSEVIQAELADIASGGGYAGVALDLIEALNGGSPRTMILNILNRGSIQGMADDDVVEIPATVSRGSIQPRSVGPIREECLELMRQVKQYERFTIDAALQGSYARALQALTAHPLIKDSRLARNILDSYVEKHGALFPVLR